MIVVNMSLRLHVHAHPVDLCTASHLEHKLCNSIGAGAVEPYGVKLV